MKVKLPGSVTKQDLRAVEVQCAAKRQDKRKVEVTDGKVHIMIDPNRINQFIDPSKEGSR